jgi:hypothetical protein
MIKMGHAVAAIGAIMCLHEVLPPRKREAVHFSRERKLRKWKACKT